MFLLDLLVWHSLLFKMNKNLLLNNLLQVQEIFALLNDRNSALQNCKLESFYQMTPSNRFFFINSSFDLRSKHINVHIRDRYPSTKVRPIRLSFVSIKVFLFVLMIVDEILASLCVKKKGSRSHCKLKQKPWLHWVFVLVT